MKYTPRLTGSAAIAAVLSTITLLSLLAPMSARAGLIVIGAPPSVLPGALTSQTDGYLFFESTTTLAAPLPVDISAPGLYSLATPDNPGVIPSLTAINSYMLHHESVDNKLSGVLMSYSFPNPILGLIVTDTKLDATDALLGNGGTAYPTGLEYRGLEIPYLLLADVLFWSGNQVFLFVKSDTALVLDQVRVITAVPEPATIWLAIAAGPFALLAARRRWRRTA